MTGKRAKTERAPLLLLSAGELQRLIAPKAAMAALQEAYAALADNRQDQAQSLGFKVAGGSIHIKAGLMPGTHQVFAAKLNVNLPGNPARHGLPTIQGVVMLADARDGQPLALMDSATLTALRTAAAAALAAKFGARGSSRRLAVIGCGAQAPFQIAAMAAAFNLSEVRLFDLDRARAERLAAGRERGPPRRAVSSVAAATEGADICVTCTTATAPLLTPAHGLTGVFVAAVGADNPTKQEIEPALMAQARIIVDDLEACAQGGDLAHAIAAGAMTRAGVHADLADLAAGRKTGRATDDELVIYDSTGSGIQDVALAWVAYEAAQAEGGGTRFALDERR